MKFKIPKKQSFINSFSVSVRWGDMDALGHINNTMYFRYMESSRVEWLTEMGLKLGYENESFVLANTMCNFILPISYPCTVNIDSYVTEITNTRMDVLHEFIDPKNKNKKFAVGLATCVWVDLLEGKAIALPEVIKNKYDI
ncbi:MAG: hypothetical protein CBD16_03055 [Betaproteobacteria bacterium TMED156]|nr:MAG: hypothetical protein CBD16_03055 [Betaproteobacteria bacterium TMED156]